MEGGSAKGDAEKADSPWTLMQHKCMGAELSGSRSMMREAVCCRQPLALPSSQSAEKPGHDASRVQADPWDGEMLDVLVYTIATMTPSRRHE